MANTYSVNLYTKLGSLKKAHFFYEKILKKSQHGVPKDNKMFQVIISANYNLGLIYYFSVFPPDPGIPLFFALLPEVSYKSGAMLRTL